ncbi:hypothetical protein PGTUg99_000022 [Puccinia graminis f. sp. tritici]|uniref:Uncharacterized protein n=1 Tax=Puccinia graminis f. sp. tritici TaxID=56615 RepID=A0A5B0N8U2_PUCGR|nr:hypothetical protein PGTUg99_000022 [Puccinia graminis f. sp. tritici]
MSWVSHYSAHSQHSHSTTQANQTKPTHSTPNRPSYSLIQSNNNNNTTTTATAQQPSEPTIIATTNLGGSIHAICLTRSNQLIIGGRFDALNSTSSTSNIAIYDPLTHAISPLSNSSSIQGTVHAIECLNDDQIWIAGQFQNPISNDQIPNLISYSTKSHSFQSPNSLNLPNFNGPIYSLDHLISPSGESLIIGGQFSISINTNNPQQQQQTPNFFDPSTHNNNNNNNTLPLPTLGSSLAPVPLSNQATCWELDQNFDNGAVTLNLGTSVPVGGIRLGNSFANGGGTAGFHFINPITNQLDSCTTNCTLSRDLKLPYQDYIFPPNTAVNGVQLVITSKFGNVAGLHLLQLLSQGNTAYAVDQLNTGRSCRTGLGAAAQNTVKTTGNWNTVKANTNLPGTTEPV